MKKVYVLFDIYDGYEITLGVFSSMKKAQEAVEWLVKIDTHYKKIPSRLSIVPFELNGERIED